MFCPNCGKENTKKTNFCANCGEKLTKEENVKENKVLNNPGGVRKALKKDAKTKVSGSLIGASAIFLVICFVLSMLFTGIAVNHDAVSTEISLKESIGSLLISLLGLIFGFGLFIVGFNKIRNNQDSFSEIFTSPFKKGKFLGYIILLFVIIFAISFIAGMLMIIPLLGFLALIGLIVAYVYFTPTIEAFMLILADNKTKEDISFIETWKKAMDISKGNRVEYWGITFSFIGWVLLSIFTLGILFIWLLPYMQLTYINMYRRWIGEETFETEESGLTNGTVVGLTAGGIGCFVILLSIIMSFIMIGILTAAHDNPDIHDRIEKFAEENNIDIDWSDFDSLYDEINKANHESA